MNFPIDSVRLSAFLAVAQEGGFRAAARVLNLSQPAVSHAIKQLEKEMECRLFEREGKSVRLTQAGEQLEVAARKILDDMERIRTDIKGLGAWGTGRLRLSAPLSICQYLLPTVIREFRESFPRCRIHIKGGDSPDTLRHLLGQESDLAVVVAPIDEARFHFRPLFEDELVFLVNPQHPWAMLRQAPRPQIREQSLIIYNRASTTHQLVERHFAGLGVTLRIGMELESMEAIKEMVKVGIGVSVLPRWVARREIETQALVAVALGTGKLRRQWGLAYRRTHALSLQEETFTGLCQMAATDL